MYFVYKNKYFISVEDTFGRQEHKIKQEISNVKLNSSWSLVESHMIHIIIVFQDFFIIVYSSLELVYS